MHESLEVLQPLFSSSRPHSLALFTSTLETSSNWLHLQYLSHLISGGHSGVEASARVSATSCVIFVSLLQSADFWRESARRVVSTLPRALESYLRRFKGCILARFESMGRARLLDQAEFDRRNNSQHAATGSAHSAQLSPEMLERVVSAEIQALWAEFPDAEVHLLLDGLGFMLVSTASGAGPLLDTVYELRCVSGPLLLDPLASAERGAESAPDRRRAFG